MVSNPKKSNLLVLAVGYPSEDRIPSHTFVKQQIYALAGYFNKIYVICPTPYFPKLLSNVKVFPHEFRIQGLFTDYKYDNVEVYYPWFVIDFGYWTGGYIITIQNQKCSGLQKFKNIITFFKIILWSLNKRISGGKIYYTGC
ncbi:MAG: hypothetical protein ACOC2M_01160 [bacterium]